GTPPIIPRGLGVNVNCSAKPSLFHDCTTFNIFTNIPLPDCRFSVFPIKTPIIFSLHLSLSSSSQSLLTSTPLSFSLFRTTLHSTSDMTKIFLLAALALASVCSALEVYTLENFVGYSCIFATPSGECKKIPDLCYGRVKSMKIAPEWRCQLSVDDDCTPYANGTYSAMLFGDNYPSTGQYLHYHAMKSVQCWT
ncbi:MAG: hypothetical protein J3Q66DRAFT_432212, partial [Benniella sp.]